VPIKNESLVTSECAELGELQVTHQDTVAKRLGKRPIQLWMVTTVTCSVVVLTAFAGFAHWRFGSLRGGLSYLAGERLIVDHHTKSFGELATGDERTVVFTVINLAGREVQILGAKVDCSCVKVDVDGLPRLVAHGAEARIGVLVRSAKKTGKVSEVVVIYTDNPDVPRLTLRVLGEFRE